MNILTFIKTDIPRAVFLAVVGLVLMAGTVHTARELNKYCAVRRTVPFSFYGDVFNGLGEVLRDEKYIGYFTDKDIKEPKYGAQFEQAQLALAPLILDLNNTHHRFVIFDCQNEKECWRKIKDINAQALKRSTLGTVLAITTPY
jgi:hypothetical protein